MKILKYVIVYIFFCIISILNVNAETGYTTDKTGLSLRDRPSTASSNYIISTIPYGVDFYISNMNAGSGNGCSRGWYYVYYQGNYGYACSGLIKIVGEVDTSYDRPWTTPKKAIVGGAKFISSGYISNGQNTSYLKKYNVNPTAFYAKYTHQYMANLRAPAGEANTTFKSLKENNLLNNDFSFVIPVYNNMPEQKYNYNGLYQVDLPTTNDTDDKFENMIKDFPDSYKPYLRYIHKLHNNWTFTPLNTNIDFNDAYLNEKYISSIEISSGYCEQNPYTVTESGWCIANDDTTKFFLDPRNFLTEKYVFMFENLGYSDIVTENTVKSVLKDTFMNDISVLDNQSYSSIFVEAGKTAKVSPLYLASLARQESGTKESITTSGKEFSYEGYTYSGLYNFFNIGASSSESNPALAGLVWANGGKGVDNATQNNNSNSNGDKEKSSVDINNDFISMLSVKKYGDYIGGYSVGTTVGTIKGKVGSSASVVIKDSNGNIKNDSDLIGTGSTIEISNSDGSMTYTYVMFGDLNGDGEIDAVDLLRMRFHLIGRTTFEGSLRAAADLNGDGEIDAVDLLRMRFHLINTKLIEQ